MKENISEKLREIASLLDPIIEDRSVPRNIRQTASECKAKILAPAEDLSVPLSEAIYALDEISNDINMPSHARTNVWNIVSEFERLREELKKIVKA